jgi:beta-phosphoglucomutase-like phosphatase (HAD superfamily)
LARTPRAEPPGERAPSAAPALVFDLDGVLVDTADLVTRSWLRYAAARHHPLTATDVRDRLFGRRTVEILQDEFRVPLADALAMVEGGFDDKAAEVAAGPGLAEIAGARSFVTAAIADGLMVALVSSASRANVALALGAIGLDDAFRVSIDAGRVLRGKPAPDPYLAAAAALERPPAELVVFEDSDAGVVAARSAGARCVGVASCLPPDRLAAADLVIDSFADWTPSTLLAALGGWCGPAERRPPELSGGH